MTKKSQANQTMLAARFSGVARRDRGGRGLRVERAYAHPGCANLRNGVIHWEARAGGGIVNRLRAAVGAPEHSAMHSEQVGRLIGCLISEDLPFWQQYYAFEEHFPILDEAMLVVVDADTAGGARKAALVLAENLASDPELFAGIVAGVIYFGPRVCQRFEFVQQHLDFGVLDSVDNSLVSETLGGSLTSLTVITNTSSKVSPGLPLSVVRTRTE